MWKYTQIPFTCDDIQSFPEKIATTTINPFKNTWNKVISRFSDEDTEIPTKPNLLVNENPLSPSTDLVSADTVENFFIKTRTSIQTKTIDVQNQISKATCERYISLLQKTQKSEWIQIVWIIIWYFLLVWIFKILLRIVSVFWFLLFGILRIFWVYTYKKKIVEKEMVC